MAPVDNSSMYCEGQHHYYVAETGTVESEGKVCVIVVCTACGEGKLLEFPVKGTPNLKKGNS